MALLRQSISRGRPLDSASCRSAKPLAWAVPSSMVMRAFQ